MDPTPGTRRADRLHRQLLVLTRSLLVELPRQLLTYHGCCWWCDERRVAADVDADVDVDGLLAAADGTIADAAVDPEIPGSTDDADARCIGDGS